MPELRDEVLAEIRRIFAEELEHRGPVEPRHALAADLDVDSMAALVLAVGLEDRFRVKLGEDEATAPVTVADLVALVERAVALAAGGGSPPAGERGGGAA